MARPTPSNRLTFLAGEFGDQALDGFKCRFGIVGVNALFVFGDDRAAEIDEGRFQFELGDVNADGMAACRIDGEAGRR